MLYSWVYPSNIANLICPKGQKSLRTGLRKLNVLYTYAWFISNICRKPKGGGQR